ncbi:MAG: amidohydrolase, partial [Chloroflexota bacterium]|nr:amidohydrolase [Chloroflexota bacterium]
LWGSLRLEDLQLDAVQTLAELGEQIVAYAAANPQHPWLQGHQVRYAIIPPNQTLDRHFLDRVVPDRPLILYSYDIHTAWANSEALRRADILHGRDLPPGHEIVLDGVTGLATGELREPEAYNPVRALIPEPDAARQRHLLRKGLALAARMGITSVHNMDGNAEAIAHYAALEESGELTLRIYVPYDVKPETPLDVLSEGVEWRNRFQGSHVRAGSIKCFMDGVLESYTALMVDVYSDGAPGNRGSALFTAAQFNRVAAEADRLGLQIAVHACGDGAVRRTLDGYAYAQRVNGRRDSRHRIEHIEVIHPNDIGRFAELGVIASMQPYHAPLTVGTDDVWPARVGPQRWPLSFAWQTLRNANAHLAFGSDWPVVNMNPLLGFYAALNRQRWAPGDPDQTQTLQQIIAGYTRDAAYVEFQEHAKGMIRTGMLADLVLLSENIFSVPPDEIAGVHPVLTVCDGRVVYRGKLC